ncbi:hypothetical protein SAMN04488543_2571 [Friedmanniella luteola]|uniref:Uncharacterized protein n=1 Tax=Friedmanniella luteola TaxID=546871 RepID=A0A1H1VV53_9ACTN|nr:Rv3235 family protein [Friedmanniella luteola]SDS88116.1 hypothetical protein SAMN04488543_2571 [Friedmanniella luteola]
MPPTLTRPLVTPVVESRPDARHWAVPAPAPAAAAAQPALDLRPAGDPLVVLTGPDAAAAVPAGLPDARAWSVALAVALLEVLAGRRPCAQLGRWLEADVLTALAGRLPRRRAGAPAPVPGLRSVRVQHPAAGVAEVAVHGRLGERPVPLALRLEARQARWLVTALEVGPLR